MAYGTYYEQRSPRQARQIGYGSYYDAEPVLNQSTLTPEQRDAMLSSIGGRTLQAAEGLFGILDTPASYLRDILAGQQLGSGTSAGDLLDAYNLRPDKETWGGWARPLAEFGAGALLDPLNLVPIGGISKAGAALKARRTLGGVNMLEDASRVMGKQLIANNDLGSWYAKNSLKSWADNFGKTATDLTDADLLARGVAGPRQSRRALTLDDVVSAQPNRQQVIDDINAWLPKNGGGTYQDIAGQTLSKDIGIAMPFSDRLIAGVNLPGGRTFAQGLDRLGQAVRWSAPLRHAHAALNKDTFGAVDEGGQIVGKEIANAIREGDAIGGRIVADKLQNVNPDAMLGSNAADISASLRRVLDGAASPQDLALMRSRPDLKRFVDDWEGPGGMAQTYLNRRAEAGMSSLPLTDRFGGKYFPRHVDDLSFLSKVEQQGITGGVKKGRAFSGATGDQMQRRLSMHVPGGTDFINKLSLDPNLAGPQRALTDELSAARYIKQKVDAEIARRFRAGTLPNGQKVPQYSLQSARRTARILAQLDERAVKNRLPMFGSSPFDDFARYVKGNERAIKVNETLFDLLGSTAKNQRWDMVAEGGHVSMNDALKRLGLKTTTVLPPGGVPPMAMQVGAKPEILSRLQARFPGAVNDLKNASLDKRMLDRLSRIADFYDYPEVQSKWLGFFDTMTRIWKASILSWPARYTRDWYSGGFSNLVEVGSARDLAKGYAGAKHLMQGDWDMLDGILQQMPRYSQMTTQARKREFINDLASTGVLGGRRGLDMADAARAAVTGEDVAEEFLPGSRPRTTLGNQLVDMLPRGVLGSRGGALGADKAAYSELGKNWNRFFSVGAKNPREVGNPIMRWGAQLGDNTDSINRSAGFMGLMLQGIDPMEAASRIKAAHVDYSSLTKLEREAIRRVIPFWSYTSRTSKWVAQKLFENPGGRFTQFGLRAPDAFLNQGEDQYVPDSIRSSYGMPVDSSIARPFGGNKAGVTSWLTDIDLPGIDQINLLNVGFRSDGTPDISQTAWNTGKELVGKLAHPWVKSGAEMITGQNMYTKRPIKESPSALGELAEDLLGIPTQSVYGETIKNISPIVDALPFAPRALQVYNRLADEDKVPDFYDRLYQMGVNAMSGVKFQNVDDQAKRVDARRKIAEILAQDPLIRSFQQPYLPEEAVPYADPDLVMMMALDRQLGRELQRERAAREGRPVSARRRNTDAASYFV